MCGCVDLDEPKDEGARGPGVCAAVYSPKFIAAVPAAAAIVVMAAFVALLSASQFVVGQLLLDVFTLPSVVSLCLGSWGQETRLKKAFGPNAGLDPGPSISNLSPKFE